MDSAVIIDFSAVFGKLRGVDFLSLIYENCRLRFLAMGEDFCCGYRMDMNAEKTRDFLAPLGVRVDILPPVYHAGDRISSTRIRGFILDGNFDAAASLLGRPYRLSGEELRGTSSAARARLTQVIPRGGRFPVLFEGTAGPRHGVLAVDEYGISWHYDGDVSAITFE